MPASSLAAAPKQFPSRFEALNSLHHLLLLLYPEPWSLDIITFMDVRRLYRLTKLGGPALTAIEQSRRILRDRAVHDQMGLGEFHVGLIYMDWDGYRAAAAPFAEARAQWSLASDTAAVCLARFAQGVALCYAAQWEAAMLHFGHVEHILDRTPRGLRTGRFVKLSDVLRPQLKLFQEVLRDYLWPPDSIADQPGRSPGDQSGAQPAEPPPSEPSQPQLVPPPLVARPEVAPPVVSPAREAGNGAPTSRPAQPAPPPDDRSHPFVPPPQPGEHSGLDFRPLSNLANATIEPSRAPIPGHVPDDPRFTWYVIVARYGDFLRNLPTGAFVLADAVMEKRQAARRDYVIVSSEQRGLGSILVQPSSSASALGHYYLGYRITNAGDLMAARLFLNESGRAVTAADVRVLAVVEGFWYGLEALFAVD